MKTLNRTYQRKQKISNGYNLANEMIQKNSVIDAVAYLGDLERLEEYEMCIGVSKAIDDYYKDLKRK